MRSVEGIVFDFDGVILDTEAPVHRSWTQVYDEHGVELPLDAWSEKIGTQGAFDQRAYLEAQLGRPLDWDEIEQRRRRRMQDALDDLEVLEGVCVWLDEAERLGLRVGLASSSPRDWVNGFCERLRLSHRFEVVRCREDVEAVKPEPHLYLSVLHALGVRPERAVAVEDSPNGIRAAKRAGMFCVAVPHDLTRGLPLGEADVVLGSLADMTLASLIRLVEAGQAPGRYRGSGG